MIALRRPVRSQVNRLDPKKEQMSVLPLEEISWSLEASELMRRGSWRRKSAMMHLAEEPRIFCDRGTSPILELHSNLPPTSRTPKIANDHLVQLDPIFRVIESVATHYFLIKMLNGSMGGHYG